MEASWDKSIICNSDSLHHGRPENEYIQRVGFWYEGTVVIGHKTIIYKIISYFTVLYHQVTTYILKWLTLFLSVHVNLVWTWDSNQAFLSAIIKSWGGLPKSSSCRWLWKKGSSETEVLEYQIWTTACQCLNSWWISQVATKKLENRWNNS